MPPAGPGNTATCTRHPLAASGGCDKLEATVYGEYSEDYANWEKELEAARVENEKGGRGLVPGQGFCLDVRAKGHRWANTFFSWVGEYDGLKISLRRSDMSDKCPVAKIEVSSLKLMREGHRAPWEQALRILRELGIVVRYNRVFQVDVCLDLAGVPVAPYCEAIFNGQAVSRIRSRASFYKGPRGEWTGISLGDRKGVQLTIYDKLAELVERGDDEAEAKMEVLIQDRWGVLPDEATRVEFKIRGEWLRQKWGGVQTVEEVFDRLPAITEHLVQNFFRIVDGVPDRGNRNQSREELSPLWWEVVNGFVGWLGRAVVELEKKKLEPNGAYAKARAEERLVGNLCSVLAFTPEYATNPKAALDLLLEVMRLKLSPIVLRQRIQPVWDKWRRDGVLPVLVGDVELPEFPEPSWVADEKEAKLSAKEKRAAEYRERYFEWG
jgi:hypothetical protein